MCVFVVVTLVAVFVSADQNSALFDASQYDFFGKNLDEMSLGGLDNDDEVIGPDDEYHLFDKAEVMCVSLFDKNLPS